MSELNVMPLVSSLVKAGYQYIGHAKPLMMYDFGSK